jgi:hypothetical protein
VINQRAHVCQDRATNFEQEQHPMSGLPPASDAGLNAAIEALTAELADRPSGTENVVPLLSHLTLGHLRAILAALSAPYVPGMVEAEYETWVNGDGGAAAKLSVWPTYGDTREDHYFLPAVSR